ncbi:MAG TPA: hypothetical protein DCZ95_01765 [Verrucomicrobia bacterium]|nr:MAG: hypothetical protein A2X46_08500 [Lentisphaerae bacterium GWF2_57_35]HBA82797.1 hypothetical protein [Verrucomicrobiota bacterium]
MNSWENGVIFLVVAAAVYFLVRALIQALSGKKPACTCMDAKCPLADACKAEQKGPDDEKVKKGAE